MKRILLIGIAGLAMIGVVGIGASLGRISGPRVPTAQASSVQVSLSDNPISVQGILRGVSGEPVQDGNYTVTFRYYDAPSDGDLLWEEQQQLSIADGLFSAYLGETEPIAPALFASNPVTYLGIQVGSDQELTPRIRASFAPYAMYSATADWNGLKDVPQGFADDIDHDVVGGLSCQTDQLARWNGSEWECFQFGPVITTHHAPGNQGYYLSMAIGSDDMPIISFLDQSDPLDDGHRELAVAHCRNIDCTEAQMSTIDTNFNVGLHTSIAIGGDGFAVISYQDIENGWLKVAHCLNVECSQATVSVVDAREAAGQSGTSIAKAADGFPIVAYMRDNSFLTVAHCADLACADSTITDLVGTGTTGDALSIVVKSDGLPMISYRVGNRIWLAACHDIPCTGAEVTDLGGASNGAVDIAVGSDGLGVVAYGGNRFVYVSHCDNPACSIFTTSRFGQEELAGQVSVTIGGDGLPVVAYGTEDLRVAHCTDLACTDAMLNIIDSEAAPLWVSVATGVDGLPIIAYYDEFRDDLKTAKCLDLITCKP